MWQGADTQAAEKGFFVGTMHISQDHGLIILEGYVTIRTGDADDPKGVFRLATWESVQQYYHKKPMRTAVVDELQLVSKWTCITDNANNYRFAQRDCESLPSSPQKQIWPVFPIGVWNQFSSLPGDSANCHTISGRANNTLNVLDYYQDTKIIITRHISGTGEVVLDFEAYGYPKDPEKGFYIGAAKLMGCERSVWHREPSEWEDTLPHLWQDMRVDFYDNQWLASVNTLTGMPDFQTTTIVGVEGYRFSKNRGLTDYGGGNVIQAFKSHNREVQSFELDVPQLRFNFDSDVILEIFGTTQNNPSVVRNHATGLVGPPSFGSEPDGIICLLVPEDNCIVQRKPVCYAHVDDTTTKVNVQFPLDVLNGTTDFTIVGNAFYTGSVNLIYMDGKPFGAPSTVHGNIFPVVRDGGTDGKPSASDGRCSKIPAVVITIVSMGMPLAQYARVVYVTAAGDGSQEEFGSRTLVAVFHTFSVWFGYGKAAGSLEEVRNNSMKTFAVFSTCNNRKGCLSPHGEGIPDIKRLDLVTESLDFAISAMSDQKEELAFISPNEEELCHLYSTDKTYADWLAQGFWAITCGNGAIIYFMRGPSFERQVNVCLSTSGPKETEIKAKAKIYGLVFTNGDLTGSGYPMVVQLDTSSWDREKGAIKIGGKNASCHVTVNGSSPENQRYYMFSPMFTDNHLNDAQQLRDIDLK